MWFAALIGCGVEVFTFTLSDTFDTVLPGVAAAEDEGVLSLDELVDLDGFGSDALAEAGVGPGDLSHMKIIGLTFSPVAPADADLDFLEAAEVWLSADGLDDVQIASAEASAEGATEIPVALVDVDLAPYVLADGLQVSTFGTGRPPVADTVVRTAITVEVGVTAGAAWSALTGR